MLSVLYDVKCKDSYMRYLFIVVVMASFVKSVLFCIKLFEFSP